MSWYRSIGVAAVAWRSTAAVLLRFSVWPPFLTIAAVQAAVALVLLFFYHPAVVRLAAPLVEHLGGPSAIHYPGHLYALPAMFFRLDLAITVLVASVAFGVATLRFGVAFGLELRETPWRMARRDAPKLVLLALLVTGLRQGISAVLGLAVPSELRAQSILIVLGVALVRWGIFVLVQTLVAYATAWIVLRGHAVGAALRDSIRLVLRTPLTTFLLVVLPAGLLFPTTFVLGDVDLSDTHVPPDAIGAILGAHILVEMVLGAFLVGSLTRTFLWRQEAGR